MVSRVTVLVVRHGRAEGNAEHRFIGQSDVPLSALGRQEAGALADRLGSIPLSRIISSDLSRCLDTMAPLAARLGLLLEQDTRLREISNGEWTGHLPAELAERWPDLWQRYVAGEDVPRPGGEKWAQVRLRVQEAVNEAVDQASDGDLLVVCTHGGPALQLVSWAAGLPTTGNIFKGSLGPVANGSISTLRFPGPRLVAYNDVGHLGVSHLEPTPPYLPAQEPLVT